jgi:hypothetical protein
MGLAELVLDPGGRAVDYRWIAINPAMERMSSSAQAGSGDATLRRLGR